LPSRFPQNPRLFLRLANRFFFPGKASPFGWGPVFLLLSHSCSPKLLCRPRTLNDTYSGTFLQVWVRFFLGRSYGLIGLGLFPFAPIIFLPLSRFNLLLDRHVFRSFELSPLFLTPSRHFPRIGVLTNSPTIPLPEFFGFLFSL